MEELLQNIDYSGIVKTIFFDHNYIVITINGTTHFNFKSRYRLEELHLNPGDEVIFQVKPLEPTTNREYWVINLRKIYINKHGLRFIDRHKSHIHGLKTLLPELLDRVDKAIDGKTEYLFDMKRDFDCDLVKTYADDQIYYAIRKNRVGHTRFVKNRKTEKTQNITLVTKKDPEIDLIIIITMYPGKSFPEPYDVDASEDALIFWQQHALVEGNYEILEGSIVNECPWVLGSPAIPLLTKKDSSENDNVS